MSAYPKPRAGVLDIEPYVPGKSSAPGVAKIFKLSSNETPLGPSPHAVAAYQKVAAHLEDYPDGAATALREAIGRVFGLDPARIVCGAGSDDLLNLWRAPIWRTAMRQFIRRTASSSIRLRRVAPARNRWWRRKRILPRAWMRSWRR